MNGGTYEIQHFVKHQLRETYQVPAGRLFQELEALGVPARLHTHESSTAACGYYGEYAKWELVEEETMKLPRVSKSAPLHAMASKKGTEVAEYDVPDQIANGAQSGPGTRAGKKIVQAPTCACACGSPINPKSTFRQGHDQRLVGNLARWTVEGTLDVVIRTRLGLGDKINDLAFIDRIAQVSDAVSAKFTPQLANKYHAAAERARKAQTAPATPETAGQPNAALVASKVKNKRAKAREDTVDVDKAVAIAEDLATQPPKTLAQAESEYAVTTGAPVKIKVGRHSYDATIHGMSQAGKITAVRYYTPGGHEMVKTEGQFKIVDSQPSA